MKTINVGGTEFEQTTGDEIQLLPLLSIMDILNDPTLKAIEAERKKITIEDGCLVLNFQYPYQIELSRLRSWRDVAAWVHHLCGKGWMNTHRIEFFIDAVRKYRGWKHPNP